MAPADSAAIERWKIDSPVRDTVGFMPYPLMPGSHIIAGSVAHPPDRLRAFLTNNQWAVWPDGSVAVVTPEPYRVIFLYGQRSSVVGEPISYDKVRVTEKHKRTWREQYQRRVPFLAVTSGGEATRGTRPRRQVEPEWPEYLPPFLPRAVHAAPDGTLWVQRTTPADQPPTFDIINRAGSVFETLRLPVGRRLVGFGERSVYLVRMDDVDLEYLERYPEH